MLNNSNTYSSQECPPRSTSLAFGVIITKYDEKLNAKWYIKVLIYSVIYPYLNMSMGVFAGPTKIGTCNTYCTYTWMQ